MAIKLWPCLKFSSPSRCQVLGHSQSNVANQKLEATWTNPSLQDESRTIEWRRNGSWDRFQHSCDPECRRSVDKKHMDGCMDGCMALIFTLSQKNTVEYWKSLKSSITMNISQMFLCRFLCSRSVHCTAVKCGGWAQA